MHTILPRSLQRPALLPRRCSRWTLPVPTVHQTLRKAFRPTRVAEAEQQSAVPEQPSPPPAPDEPSGSVLGVELAEEEDLELLELDQAQENLLKWLMLDKATQEEDLGEMIDYDDFGDDEYADMYEEVEEMLEAVDYSLNVGDQVLGTVIEIEDDGAYVEIGAKSIAFCPVTECSFARLKTPLEALRPGMQREFVLVADEERYGQPIVSIAALEASTHWERMRQLREEDVAVSVRVESVNRGGMLVRYGPFDGFLPVSQLGPSITADSMGGLIGSELQVKFLEIDEVTERLLFSHKQAGGLGPGARSQFFQPGDVVSGVVQSVKPYGAFIDLGGGVRGLLHVSQVSSDRILVLGQVLSEGERIKVMVLSTDAEKGRLTLSTKKLEPTPGDMLRDPKLVYEHAEEMAARFRERAAAAAADAAASEGPAAAGGGELYVY